MEAVVENAARRVAGRWTRPSSGWRVTRCGWWRGMDSLRTSFAIGESVPVHRDRVGGRAVLDRRTIHVEDIRAARGGVSGHASRAKARGSAIRTMVGTPLLREGMPLGVLFVNRRTRAYSVLGKQIALLETFADQAVIAIENVRLFTGTAGADRRADAFGGRASSPRRGRPSDQLDVGPRDRADNDREPRGPARRHGRWSNLRVRRRGRAVLAARRAWADGRPGCGPAGGRHPQGRGRVGATGGDARADSDHRHRRRGRVREPLTRVFFWRRASGVSSPYRSCGRSSLIGGLVVNRQAPGEFAPEVVELLRRTSPHNPRWPFRMPGSSTRSRTRDGCSRRPAATSRSSSPTCPTSSGRR